MEALACTALEDPERSAVLLGAAENFWLAGGTRQESRQHLVADYDECVQRTQRELGTGAYERAFRRGLSLTPADAVAYALGVPSPVTEPVLEPEPPVASSPTTLTPRERQVAELIGRGLSNKDIAGALVIAQRTAEGHVENILSKLGLRSRSQVASWVTQQRPEKGS
jgi:DNA-binding NarL/FixJ family response regulator